MMFARVNRFTGPPERLEDGLAMFREQVLPHMEKQPGFDGALFMADRTDEVVYAITFWSSEGEMVAGAEIGRRLAEEAARKFGSEVETSPCEVLFSKLPMSVV
jgi:heme-degrading monooxygenase HmoA